MESWSCVSGGKGSVENDTISPPDSSLRSKNCLMGWELNTPSRFGNNILVSDQQAIQNQSFGEFGIQELVGQPLPNNPVNDVSSSRCGPRKVTNPAMPTLNRSFNERESTTKLSSSAVDSNSSHDLSLIDLNLGRFADQRDVRSSKFCHGAPIFVSSDSSKPPKRVRSSGISSLTACCQVYDCNKNLSSSKDYHKRHKVCEVHSKAAKVIVNGIEQRFCQQCSRFHLLAEFDDGKRSCRKRLAGHNERRRKPQVSFHSGRTAKLLQSRDAFAGCRFQGTTSTMSSFICQDILPSVFFQPEKSGTNDWCKRITVEDGTAYNPVSATPITNGNVYSKSFFPHYDFEKVVPSSHDKEANAATESTLGLNSARFPHDMGWPNSDSSPLFPDTTLGSEDFTVFDAGSTIQGFSGISESSCALSLLSPKSQNPSSHLSGIPMARPLFITGSYTHYNIGHFPEKHIAISLQASTSGISNKFSSSGNYSVEGSNFGSILMSDSSDAANFAVGNRIYHRSDFMHSKDQVSCDDGATTNLLQLSSQLERVEYQHQSMQVKDENDSFCCLRMT